MKTTLLAIAFAVASMPLTFAAQTAPATPAAAPKTSNGTVKAPKKHGKKPVKKAGDTGKTVSK